MMTLISIEILRGWKGYLTCNENNSEQGDQRAKITTSIGFSFFFFSVSAIKLLLRSFVFRTAIYIEKWLDGKRKKNKNKKKKHETSFSNCIFDWSEVEFQTYTPTRFQLVSCLPVCLSVCLIHSFIHSMEWNGGRSRRWRQRKSSKMKDRKEIICYEERTSRVSIVWSSPSAGCHDAEWGSSLLILDAICFLMCVCVYPIQVPIILWPQPFHPSS